MAINSPDPGKTEARLVSGSILGHLVAQTLPMILGIAAIMSVGIVDAYFVGQLGPGELAAMSYVFPVTMALSSLGVGVIAGISSVVSRALGGDDHDRARQLGNLGITMSILFGLVVAALLFLFNAPLFRLLQADPEIQPLIDAYMTPFALFFPILLLMMGINGCLRGQGAAKRAAAILLTYAIANWILDPMLITGAFGLFDGFGIAGAAYATIGGWLAAGIVAFVLLQTSEIPYHPRHLRRCEWIADTVSLLRVSGPAAFSNAINPLGLAVMTAFLSRHGQAAVAGYGAGGRVESFAVVPLLALSSSIGAIVGQNWGAREFGRVREALLYSAAFALIYGFVVAAALVGLGGALGAMFSNDPEVKGALATYLSITVWGYAGYGVAIVANGALNAIGRAGLALAQSLGRVLLIMVPSAWLLRSAWGATGVYTAELLANIAGGAVAAFLAWRIFWKVDETAAPEHSARLAEA